MQTPAAPRLKAHAPFLQARAYPAMAATFLPEVLRSAEAAALIPIPEAVAALMYAKTQIPSLPARSKAGIPAQHAIPAEQPRHRAATDLQVDQEVQPLTAAEEINL